MKWEGDEVWREKLGKRVEVEEGKVGKVGIRGKGWKSGRVKLEVKEGEGECGIRWVKVELR